MKTRRLAVAVVISLAWAWAGACGAGCASAPPPLFGSTCPLRELRKELRCTLAAPPEVRSGDPVPVRVTLTNTMADRTLFILRASLPMGSLSSELFVVRRDGRPIRYEGHDLVVNLTALRPDRYVALRPGEELTATADLAAEGYAMEDPGRYEIDFAGPLDDVYGAPDGRAQPLRRGGTLSPAVTYCDRAIVKVVSR